MIFNKIRILSMIVLFTGLVGLTYYYRLQAQTFQREMVRNMAVAHERSAALSKLQAQLNTLSDLDSYYTEQLSETENQNAILRRQLATSTYRMRIRTRASSNGTNKGACSCSMGNDASIGLSSDTGQDILSIREGISQDRQKIAYLQEYIRQVCLDQKIVH